MKLLYVILFHKEPKQLFRLVDRLSAEGNHIVLHICKNVTDQMHQKVKAFFSTYHQVHFCERVRGTWCTHKTVEAMCNGMKYAIDHQLEFDYCSVISAQDYPIKNNAFIQEFFTKNKGKQFINYWDMQPIINANEPYYNTILQRERVDRETSKFENYTFFYRDKIRIEIPGNHNAQAKRFSEKASNCVKKLVGLIIHKRKFLKGMHPYGGSDWYSLSYDAIKFIVQVYEQKHHPINKFMRTVACSSEIYFQTLLLNSDFRDQVVNDNLRLIIWPKKNWHPDIIQSKDIQTVLESNALYARKFDQQVDQEIFDLIDQQLLFTNVKTLNSST